MASEIFINFSIILLLVVAVSFIMRFLKQPLILGYILVGIIVGPYLFNLIEIQQDYISYFASIGIAILLFIVGLHLNPKVIKDVGGISLLTGIGQVLFTTLFGFLITFYVFGFSAIISIYVAIALTFSSTIIITKLLSDKKDLDSLYGKISIGFLIVQDIIAILILMVISSMGSDFNFYNIAGRTFILGLILLAGGVLIGMYVLPPITKKIAKSQEFLLVFSLAWCFSLAALFYSLNLSFEIGALVAGFTLAMSPYRYEIASKLKSLKDFFLIMFFILLGSQMVFGNFFQYLIPIIVLSLFVLIGNPLIVLVIMGRLGYTSRTSLFAGFTVAQISEFSLILVALGVKMGHLSAEILSFVTVIGLVTFAGSTYLVTYNHWIYSKLSKYISIFQKKDPYREKRYRKSVKKSEAILFGYNRVGFSILKSLKKIDRDVLIVDFDPDNIQKLRKKKVEVIYGDAEDDDLLDELGLDKSKIIVSTIPDFDTNMLLLGRIREKNKKAIVILTAHQISDALAFYKSGADYVVLPHFLGGSYAAELLEKNKYEKSKYHEEKKKQINLLKERIKEGHEHPRIERG
jgi:Kef-type K+ transport system membrane component KefB/Trk K+ transport system NAD-binding subunit